MSIKSIIYFLTCLFLLSSVTSPVRACPPPDCGDCKEWDPVQEECVWKEGAECEDSLDCKTCYYCINCQCELPYGSECGEDDPCPGECHTCVGSEVCLCENDDSKCNTANCEKCVSGSCEYQCDPETQVCCDGTCTPKCEDGEPTGQCDTSHNEEYECIGCTVFPYNCSDFTMREYYGNEVRYCTGGCPGDCVQQNAVECYVEYDCKYGTQLPLSICATQGDGVACVDYPDVWFCTPCVKNGEEWEIEYAYPKECQ